jgi:pantoate--beta-alanine ligase
MPQKKKSGRESRPTVISTRREIRASATAAKAAGKRVGLVPTMGALHAGHLSLVERAANECEFVIVTIFVNPTQFGPAEDFSKYPRTLEADLEALTPWGVDIVFCPSDDEMYRPGHSTSVAPPSVSGPLEGECRPGHFGGVATVCLKLFHLASPDVAYFGQKDYQQAAVIRQMVDDLDVPLKIEVCPTVREPDGLAMSSRNAYLSPEERQQALAVPRCLFLARDLIANGECDGATIGESMKKSLVDAGVGKIDYATIIEPVRLSEVDQVEGPVVAIVAAMVGATRLIDNLPID